MKNEEKMQIVYVADANYMTFVEKSAASLLKVNPKAHITVVSPEPVECKFDNVVIPLKEKYKSRGENDRITQTTYLKLFLTELPFEKIIYLDGDTIVQKPLDELWHTKVQYIGLCESHEASKKQAEDLGVEKYGLSGMMLMQLKNLRRINFTEKCLSVHPEPELWCHEETLINVAMKGKLQFLPIKYNYCYDRNYGTRTIAPQDVAIWHICGKHKTPMEYEPYDEILGVKNFIKDKTVAIVGNAQSIFDKQNGKKIDAHDVVIRFNRGFITNQKSQGTKTDILIMACELNIDEKSSFKAMYYVNRSNNTQSGDLTIKNRMRARLRAWIGKQPSSGFMAIDLCREAGAAKIDLYGFDFEKTPTFYNPADYVTQHDYASEEAIVCNMAKLGILTIN